MKVTIAECKTWFNVDEHEEASDGETAVENERTDEDADTGSVEEEKDEEEPPGTSEVVEVPKRKRIFFDNNGEIDREEDIPFSADYNKRSYGTQFQRIAEDETFREALNSQKKSRHHRNKKNLSHDFTKN
jgi:hypothetical protein